MILTVTGGRNVCGAIWRIKIWAELDSWPIALLRHGGARGFDTICAQWAAARGISCQAYAADWAANGPAAGPIRNQRMIEAVPRADMLLAGPGGPGTTDCVRKARNVGIPIHQPWEGLSI